MFSEEWLQVISSICFLQVKLKMNYHGCIDTLQEECKRWFDKHARDGTNKTARARWGKDQTNKWSENNQKQATNKQTCKGWNKQDCQIKVSKTKTNKHVWNCNEVTIESKYSDKIVFPGFHASRCTITVILWWHGEFWIKTIFFQFISNFPFLVEWKKPNLLLAHGQLLSSPTWMR